MAVDTESCANCGRLIGKLETPRVWRDNVVCPDCWPRLTGTAAVTAAPLAMPKPTPAGEHDLWSGRPSLMLLAGVGIKWGVLWLLSLLSLFAGPVGFVAVPLVGVLAALVILGKTLKLKALKYRLTNERLFASWGILSRQTTETELFRVRDVSVEKPFFARLVGLGRVRLTTVDDDTPMLYIEGIHHPDRVKEMLRANVMEARRRTGTRDLEISR